MIKSLLIKNVKGSILQKKFNVSRQTISNIKHNRSWTHVK